MNFKTLSRALVISIASILLVSCGPKKEKPKGSGADTVLDVHAAESDYLKKRREYAGLPSHSRRDNVDSLVRADQLALLDLEERLKTILKKSHFSGKGKIPIETFIMGIGSDMLDGLVFKRDSSSRVFHTSQNLFADYFKGKEGNDFSRNLNAAHFENVFTYAFQSDARVNSYWFSKITSPDSIDVYGMVAQNGQGDSTLPPQYIYVFVAMKDFVYMAEIDLKMPIQEISKCKSILDSLLPNDNAYHKYYECYNQELEHHPQFPGIRKQMQSIAGYLIDPEVHTISRSSIAR